MKLEYQDEAMKYLDLIGWKKTNKIDPCQATIGMVYEKWSEQYFSRVVKKTRDTYYGIWKKSFFNISNMLFVDLRVDHIQAMFNYHVSQEMSKSWLNKFRQLGNFLYTFAISENIVTQNLMKYADYYNTLPETKNKREIFNSNEINLLFKYAENKKNLYWHDARIVLILIFTGFRPSELFDIQLKDVNLQKGYFIGGAKTDAGKFRMVPILPVVEKYILEEYKHSKIKKGNFYFLLSENQKKINLDNWRRRRYYPMLGEVGIQYHKKNIKLTPYSARHTFASLAYRAHVDKLVLQKVIGHVDFEMLSKVYIHTNIEQYQNEFKKVNELFENLGG